MYAYTRVSADDPPTGTALHPLTPPYRYDHPVDGLVTEQDGSVHFLVHLNVPAISPKVRARAWPSLCP